MQMQSLQHWNIQCQEPVSVLVSGLNSHLKTNSLCIAWNLPGVCLSSGGLSENACLKKKSPKEGPLR